MSNATTVVEIKSQQAMMTGKTCLTLAARTTMAEKPAPKPDPNAGTAERVVRAEDLFQGERQVCIDHAGVRCRLRITRRNKLILQK